MPTQSSVSKSKSKPVQQKSGELDAIALLTQDHENVKALFEQYEGLGERAFVAKKKLAMQICTELIKHATAEEELFYPAVHNASSEAEDLVDEALVEHAAAKDLIAQILSMDAQDELYDAKIKVLSEQIEHHIGEEESELFPKARKAKLDLLAIGKAIALRKEEISVPSPQSLS